MRNPTHGGRTHHRTALKSIRYLGSAKDGTDHFIRQRITALANAVLVLVLVFVAISLSQRTHAEAVALLSSPFVAVLLALAILSVCVHLKLGLQVVIEDYISADGLRLGLLVLNTFFAVVLAGVALFALVRIMLNAAVGLA